MALLTSEVNRLRYELGYNVLDVGAEPYIGIAAIFDRVIATYLRTSASTTCSTAVVAAPSSAAVTLTLTSAVGFAAGDRVVLDDDDRQEQATVQVVAGSTIKVILSLAHTAPFPVTVEGGESMVREHLRELRSLASQISQASSTAGIKKVDEIEFFPSASGASVSRLKELQQLREYWRNELASLLGIVYLRAYRAGDGSTCEAY